VPSSNTGKNWWELFSELLIDTTMSTSSVYDKLFKLLIVGDGDAGTSELLAAFTSEQGSESSAGAALQTDFTIKFMERHGKRLKLQVWDAGKEQDFKTASTSYYRGANGVLLLYNACSELGIQNVRLFIEEIGKYGQDNVQILLVSNRWEENGDVLDLELGEQIACRHGLEFIHVDITKGDRVGVVFEKLVDLLMPPEPASSLAEQQAIEEIALPTNSHHGSKRCIIL